MQILKVLVYSLLAAPLAFSLSGCREASLHPTDTTHTEDITPTPTDTAQPIDTVAPPDYRFDGSISKEVLCSYLSRAVTISLEPAYYPTPDQRFLTDFILDSGSKYLCRFATCWVPTVEDEASHENQRAVLDLVHRTDPDIIFEACIFECVTPDVEQIAIPPHVFEAFDLPVEERCFDYESMCFPDGTYRNQWGENASVPDMTRIETRMFFYHRACRYIDLGYEALHLGQVHLIGAHDEGWRSWTEVLSMIRDYAADHARRHFVLLNAHTHGLIDANGKLMFDFHMYPSRPKAVGSDAHSPTEENPQICIFDANHVDSIYGKSLGGVTYSGWSCTPLPYLVELDNYGNDLSILNQPRPDDWRCWGMDEISWFASQSPAYRASFLAYAKDWVENVAGGDGFLAMPGQRVATVFNARGQAVKWQYFAYDPAAHPEGFGDADVIASLWGKSQS